MTDTRELSDRAARRGRSSSDSGGRRMRGDGAAGRAAVRGARAAAQRRPASPSALAARNRVASLSGVLAYLVLTADWVPDPGERALLHYRLVLTLGYGHLIGAALLGRRRTCARLRTSRSPGVATASLLCGLAILYTAYRWGLAHFPLLLAPLVGAATWHTVENDRVLGRAYAGGLALPPLDRSTRGQLLAIGVSSLILALAAQSLEPAEAGAHAIEALARTGRWIAALTGLGLLVASAAGAVAGVGRRLGSGTEGVAGALLMAAALALPSHATMASWLSFGDLFAATTLYHLLSWLVLLAHRCTERVAPARTFRPLIAVHLIPAALCGLAMLSPAEWAGRLRDALFSPPAYLFWSLLHVVQTIGSREARARAMDCADQGGAGAAGPGNAPTQGTSGQ